MRFQSVDENKIKIEITKEDLDERDLKIVELAYGSDKAREFFQEIMELAYDELGFDVNNIPILVEAVPMSLEEICIYVTKVTNPNELEKKLTSMPPKDSKNNHTMNLEELRKKLEEARDNVMGDITSNKKTKNEVDEFMEQSNLENEEIIEPKVSKSNRININIAIFSFENIDDASFATKRIPSDIEFKSSLILNKDRYYLTMETKKVTDQEFIKIENFLHEYGNKHISTIESKHYLLEHGEIIIKKDAIKVLSNFS